MADTWGEGRKVGALRPFIVGGLARGESANRLYLAARAAGLGTRRTEFLRLVRTIKDEASRRDRFKHIPLALVPGESFLKAYVGLAAGTRSYTFYYEGQAYGLTEPVRGRQRVIVGERAGRRDIEELARSEIALRFRGSLESLDTMRFVQGGRSYE